MSQEDFEREELIKEISALQERWVNPDFSDQLREVLQKYIIFRKDRCPDEIT